MEHSELFSNTKTFAYYYCPGHSGNFPLRLLQYFQEIQKWEFEVGKTAITSEKLHPSPKTDSAAAPHTTPGSRRRLHQWPALGSATQGQVHTHTGPRSSRPEAMPEPTPDTHPARGLRDPRPACPGACPPAACCPHCLCSFLGREELNTTSIT